MEMRSILGVPVVAMDGAAAFAMVREAVATRTHRRFAFLNAHGANLAHGDPTFRKTLRGFTVLPDGAGVDIASKWLYGAPFPANLNGTDFVPALLNRQREGWTVGLLGAAPGVAEVAAANWAAAFPQHEFRIVSDGFLDAAKRDRVLSGLVDAPVDLLLVAMGNPQQEMFIAQHVDARHATVVMGVGALLDFAAGRVVRAPKPLRRARIEWTFRLLQEPRRLWRRYVIGNPLFLGRVQWQRWFGHG